jgi:ABC-type Fe3+-hydroxamate transport system substrate-binding protein
MRVASFPGTRRAFRFVAVAAVAAVACGRQPSPAAGGVARRVVSLAPAFTEILFAIGAGDRVVGRTAWCDTPPAALEVPSVGDGISPNVEAILARNPDLVVVYPSAANAAPTERLNGLGIRTLTLSMDRLTHVADAARLLGEATGAGDRATALAARFTAALDSAHAVPPPAAPPRVLLLTWDAPPIVIGGGSFQSELVTLAGAENVFADLPQPSAHVTIETIAARDPDLVLLLGEGEPSWAARPEWQVVRAVRERRFGGVQGTEFARPTFRALDAVRRLRATLDSLAR